MTIKSPRYVLLSIAAGLAFISVPPRHNKDQATWFQLLAAEQPLLVVRLLCQTLQLVPILGH